MDCGDKVEKDGDMATCVPLVGGRARRCEGEERSGGLQRRGPARPAWGARQGRPGARGARQGVHVTPCWAGVLPARGGQLPATPTGRHPRPRLQPPTAARDLGAWQGADPHAQAACRPGRLPADAALPPLHPAQFNALHDCMDKNKSVFDKLLDEMKADAKPAAATADLGSSSQAEEAHDHKEHVEAAVHAGEHSWAAGPGGACTLARGGGGGRCGAVTIAPVPASSTPQPSSGPGPPRPPPKAGCRRTCPQSRRWCTPPLWRR